MGLLGGPFSMFTYKGRMKVARRLVANGVEPPTPERVTRLTMYDPRAGRWYEEIRREMLRTKGEA